MQFRRDLAKSIIAAVSLVLMITIVAAYVLPQYVYVNPFSTVYVNGIVNYKAIGHGTTDGVPIATYNISVTLLNDDPVNNIQSGLTVGYLISQEDWNPIEWGDTVKIKVLPNLNAELVNLFPVSKPISWRSSFLDGFNIKLSTDKQNYSTGETVNFTVAIENLNQSTLVFANKTLSIFKTLSFWVYNSTGNQIYSSSPNVTSETQEVHLELDQTVYYNFQWTTDDLSAGYYTIRVYVGYFSGDDDASLTGTQTIQVI